MLLLWEPQYMLLLWEPQYMLLLWEAQFMLKLSTYDKYLCGKVTRCSQSYLDACEYHFFHIFYPYFSKAFN